MNRSFWSRPWIGNLLLPWLRRLIPPISSTEREALEAGTIGWDGELFSGRPDWEKLLSLPTPRLSPEERQFIDGPVESLCGMIDDWKITHEDYDLPPEAWEFLKKNGFFGMIIPRRYGGLEFSALAHSTVVMKVASRSVSAAVTVMVPNSLGPAKLLWHYGTEAQKDYYLPRLARGEEIPCFALTGPEAGSDAASLPDTGIVCQGEHQGNRVTGIRLNWEKRYITLGPMATLIGLAFKLYDPDGLLGSRKELGITLALVPANLPGVEIGRRHLPLNLAFQNGPNRGKDVFIPLEAVIGGPQGVGQGWRMLMECLSEGRAISLPALSTSAGKFACRATGAYARVRRQFNMPIGFFEGVEAPLARMAGRTYVMDAARTLTAVMVDQGEKPSVLSAVVKYNLTEIMRRTVIDAMDIQGGSGICLGPRNLLGRVYQALPISITVEGANILTRSLIIFGQGAVRSHPYVRQEMDAMEDPDPGRAAGRLQRAVLKHGRFFIANLGRSLTQGLTRGRFAPVPATVAPETRSYYRQISRFSAAFALTTDVALMMMGGALKRSEHISGRLADVLSHMFLASAVLKRFEDQGRPAVDLPLVHWACQDALVQAQEALGGVFRNFPNRPAAWLLRKLIFPTGLHLSPPDDRLGHQAAGLLLAPGPARDRLTEGVYLPRGPREALGRLEEALKKVTSCALLEQRLRAAQRELSPEARAEDDLIDKAEAMGRLTSVEAQTLREARAATLDVIQVDDFPPDFRIAPSPTFPPPSPLVGEGRGGG